MSEEEHAEGGRRLVDVDAEVAGRGGEIMGEDEAVAVLAGARVAVAAGGAGGDAADEVFVGGESGHGSESGNGDDGDDGDDAMRYAGYAALDGDDGSWSGSDGDEAAMNGGDVGGSVGGPTGWDLPATEVVDGAFEASFPPVPEVERMDPKVVAEIKAFMATVPVDTSRMPAWAKLPDEVWLHPLLAQLGLPTDDDTATPDHAAADPSTCPARS